MFSLSAIVCTYNPDPAILEQCLDGIAAAHRQFPIQEVLIIDNNSKDAVAGMAVVKDFTMRVPETRLIGEPAQGLTNARLRAIKEAKGDLLVFIDDDNLIAADFFEKASRVASLFPFIGAFSGKVDLVFNQPPPQWTKKYWGLLVYRTFTGNHWGNIPFNNDFMPCGAGMCVRKEVANHYFSLHENGKRKFHLDRSKDSLLSGGDNDLAMCACDIGMGMGLFEDLSLRHFIPQNRFTKEYLTKLAYGIYYSSSILKFLRTGEPETLSSKRRMLNGWYNLFRSGEDASISRAADKGILDARQFLQNH